ncbi:MAG: hypothetical protein LRY50_07145 [Geovibrio sp.]|nr:hypothetical protein [Geovibrio sp.]
MNTFHSNIISIYGEKGRQWLGHLPNRVAQLANTYGLSNLKAVNNLSYNYVVSGLQGPQPIILKLGLDIDGFKREAAALMAFSGFGVVEILSENNGLLLVECAVPGIFLKSYFPDNDDQAINITANVIKRLHKAPIPSTHAFPHIKDWLEALDGDLEIPVHTLQKASIVEKAGGAAIDGINDILDIKPEGIHQRTPLIIGSKHEVELYRKYMKGEA